jgi:hypothetical protein
LDLRAGPKRAEFRCHRNELPFDLMSVDHIRYDLLVREALRGVVRRVVADVAKNGGLPGDHHFYIAFETRAPGVRISARLRAQYPEEMTIVLQHQFWDLAVTDAGIDVGLSFGGVPEKLFVPFEAIKGFFDPSVQFGLEFEVVTEKTGDAGTALPPAVDPPPVPTPQLTEPPPPPSPRRSTGEKRPRQAGESRTPKDTLPDVPSAIPPSPEPLSPDAPGAPQSESGAEVVRLDRFRKK